MCPARVGAKWRAGARLRMTNFFVNFADWYEHISRILDSRTV